MNGWAANHGFKGFCSGFLLRGAFLEVFSHLLGSVGVIVAGGIMWATGWWYADPIFSVVIGLFILPRTWKLMSQAVDVLLEATPAQLNLREVQDALLGIDGVASVHDLHAWTVTSGIYALSVHLSLEENVQPEIAATVVDRAATVLEERFAILHSTIQIERGMRRSAEVQF